MKKVSTYYLSPKGTATVKAAAILMGIRLRQLREQRDSRDEEERQRKSPGLPPITIF